MTVSLARAADLAGDRPREPAAASDPAWVLDVLHSAAQQPPSSAIVVVGLDPWGVGAEAVYAPAPSDGAPEGKGAQTQDQMLATGSGIEDSSRPPALKILDLGLAGLLQERTSDG